MLSNFSAKAIEAIERAREEPRPMCALRLLQPGGLVAHELGQFGFRAEMGVEAVKDDGQVRLEHCPEIPKRLTRRLRYFHETQTCFAVCNSLVRRHDCPRQNSPALPAHPRKALTVRTTRKCCDDLSRRLERLRVILGVDLK